MGILRSDVISHSQLESTGGSIVLDGVGDYLTFAASGAFSPATSDVTFELWFYLTDDSDFSSGSGNYYLFDMGSNGYRIQMYEGLIRFGIDGSTWTPPASGVSKTTWHHAAGVRQGNSLDLYLDGNHVGQKSTTASVTSTSLTIGNYGGAPYDGEPYGYISNFRFVKGVVYDKPFTPPKFELKNIAGTIVLGCQSSSSATDFAVTPSAITAQGNAAASSFHPDLKKDNTDTGVVLEDNTKFDTLSYMVPPGGTTAESNRGRAVFFGGYQGSSPAAGVTNIDYLNIQSGGISKSFGTLLENRRFDAGLASATRGVTGGSDGQPSWATGKMEYVTIATTSNSTTFGDMTQAGGMVSACSNNTRGLFFSVWDANTSGSSHKKHIDYITIASAGNSADFGELSVARPEAAGFGSPTRGICAGGYDALSPNNPQDTIDYVTIATTGNATDFGNLTVARQAPASASSSTRGVITGGYAHPAWQNTIDYVTIATTGNATDFGDLVTALYGQFVGNCSDKIRGVFAGGKISAPTYSNSIDYVTIATTGNTQDFGDIVRGTSGYGSTYGSICSDSHGGIS